MDVLTGWWDDFFWGSVVVAQVFLASLVLMVIFGLIGAAAKLSGNRIAHKIANGYTIVFRGTPEILVILLLYFGEAFFPRIAEYRADCNRAGVQPRDQVSGRAALLGRDHRHRADRRILRDRDVSRGLSGRQTRQYRGGAGAGHEWLSGVFLCPRA